MALKALQLSTTNVAGQVVTLPIGYGMVFTVQTVSSGDYPATSAKAPVTHKIVYTTPATTEVQLSASNELTFGSTVVLDKVYGTLLVDGLGIGQGGGKASL